VWYKKRTRFSGSLILDREDFHEMSLLPTRLQFQRTVLDKIRNLTYITVSYGTINNEVTLLLPCNLIYFSSFSEIEFIQYRRPVGFGPSSKTCPKWAPHFLHSTSTLNMP